jgi:hypothetical protein
MLIGDSHTNHLTPGFMGNARFKGAPILSIGATQPTLDVDVRFVSQPYDNPALYMGRIDAFYRDFIGRLDPAKPRYAVLSALWPIFSDDGEQVPVRRLIMARDDAERALKPQALFVRGLDRFISLLESKNIQVVIALDLPAMPSERAAKACLIPRLGSPASATPCAFLPAEAGSAKGMMAVVKSLQATHPQLKVFDPVPDFCPGGACRSVDQDGHILWRDSNHLSEKGSAFYAAAFEKWAEVNWPEVLPGSP